MKARYISILNSKGNIFFKRLRTATCWLTLREILQIFRSNLSLLSIGTPRSSISSWLGITVPSQVNTGFLSTLPKVIAWYSFFFSFFFSFQSNSSVFVLSFSFLFTIFIWKPVGSCSCSRNCLLSFTFPFLVLASILWDLAKTPEMFDFFEQLVFLFYGLMM